jgi:hypothetical protein
VDFETPAGPDDPGAGAPPRPPAPEPGVPIADLQPPAPAQPRRRWRWLVGSVVAIALVLVTVVATAQHASKSPLEVLTAASGRTTGSGTARVSSVETLVTNGKSVEILDVAGATDFARKASSLTMSTRGHSVLDLRQVAGVTYMSSSLVDLPDSAHWIAIRPADLKLGPDDSALGSNDPSSGLKYLSAIKGNPRVVGHDQIDGVDTTHYTFTVDLRAYMDRAARASKAMGSSLTGSAVEQLGRFVDLKKLPAAAWLDGDGRVRRFVLTIGASQGGESFKAVSTITFSHFDEPVSVSAPPPSDTIPFSRFPNFLTEMSPSGQSAL